MLVKVMNSHFTDYSPKMDFDIIVESYKLFFSVGFESRTLRTTISFISTKKCSCMSVHLNLNLVDHNLSR